MAATYDLSTNNGKVRLLIGDTDVTPAADADFTDEELAVFLSMAGNSLNLAGALALESLAASNARLALKIKSMNWEKDTTQVAKELRAQAKALRDAEEAIPATAYAEQTLTDFNETNIVDSEALRDL